MTMRPSQCAGAVFVVLALYASRAYLRVMDVAQNQPPLPVLSEFTPPIQPVLTPLTVGPLTTIQPNTANLPGSISRTPPQSTPEEAVKPAKPKSRRTGMTAEADALKLLGRSESIQVIRRPSPRKDPQLDELIRRAEATAGQEIYPAAIATARTLKQTPKVQCLQITPSENPRVEEIADILGAPTRTKTDPTNPSITWHHYFWLDFGITDGKVVKLQINCLLVPATGS
jgi:hypothetical protein